MPMTLEMPTDLGSTEIVVSPGTNAADEAASLVDSPDDETDAEELTEIADPPTSATEGQPGAGEGEQSAADEPPAKKKRGRKKKQAEPGAAELGEDHPFDTNAPAGEAPADAVAVPLDTPHPPKPPVDNSLSEHIANQPTSAATRAFQVAKVKADYIEVCLEIQEAEELIDRTKTRVKHLTEIQSSLSIELRSIRNDDQFQPRLPMGGDTAPKAQAGPAASVPPAPSAATFSDNWRSALIESLALPPKLAEKLEESGVSNIGQLEDLRAEIALGKSKWPKGIGAAKITQIEDAVVNWLTENRDAAAFAEVGQPDTTPTADQWESFTDDQQQEYICARAVTLDTGETNSLTSKSPDGTKAYDSGYEAFGRDLKVSECPYIPGDCQDDWILGWLAAGKVEAHEPSVKTEGKQAQPNSPSPMLSDLDDL